MRFIFIIHFLSFIISYSQVNPEYHKVKAYTRKDGTRVEAHYRTNRNNTNKDNYSTKPNINPWTGQKGYINPHNKINNYNTYYYPKNKIAKTATNEKPVSKYYPSDGNSKTVMIAKLRNKPEPYGDVLVRIPKGARIQIIQKENGYWKIKYGSWTGFLNEMYISNYQPQKKNIYTKNYSSEKSVSNYYPKTGNAQTIMIAKLRNKPEPFGDILVRIPKGAKVQKIDKENGYWKIKYGSWTGFLNEMYLSNYQTQNKNDHTKKYYSEKSVSNYYPKTGNSRTVMISKLRNKPEPLGDILVRIPKGAKIQKIREKNGYWKVKYGSWIGFLNEMYIE